MFRDYRGNTRVYRARALAPLMALAILAIGLAPLRAEKRLNVEQVEKGYVEALALLAQGDHDRALDALMVVETEALGAYPSTSRIDRVWRLKLGVVRKALELSSEEVLVPVIVFHHDAYDRYRESKQPVLARHARDMASDLAAYKVQSGTAGKDDKAFAGWVLASFGASLLDLRTSGTSASILQDALDMAPDNPAALLGLAWAHEIHGEYREASERLRVLLRAQPDHDEALLRLAVCEQRLGELPSARKSFEELLERETEPWIRSVGYQEFTRTLMLLEQENKAESLARQALAEFPEDQELRILVSALSERRGGGAEASQIISKVAPADPERVSARYLYDSSPELGIEDARATMRQMMDDRLGVLSSGLRWWGADDEPQEAQLETGG
jgi:tetratricopeptide (TPR) repeat protein